MVDFFDEVIQDVKQEKLRRIFEKHGNFIVSFLLLIVVVTGGTVWYKGYQNNQIAASADLYFSAAEDRRVGKKDESAETINKIIKDGSGGYVSLAGILKAGSLAKGGKIKEAIEAYDSIADGASEKEIRDLALIQKIYLLNENPDAAEPQDPAELIAELEGLTAVQDPWRYTALELQGVIAFKAKDAEKAKEIFQTLLNDSFTPRSIKERATIMLSAVSSS